VGNHLFVIFAVLDVSFAVISCLNRSFFYIYLCVMVLLCVGCSGCKHKGQLFVSGGFRGPIHGHVSQFCYYDAECDVWRQRAPLTVPRSYHSMSSVHDHIMVAGGVHYHEDTFDDLLVISLLKMLDREVSNHICYPLE